MVPHMAPGMWIFFLFPKHALIISTSGPWYLPRPHFSSRLRMPCHSALSSSTTSSERLSLHLSINLFSYLSISLCHISPLFLMWTIAWFSFFVVFHFSFTVTLNIVFLLLNGNNLIYFINHKNHIKYQKATQSRTEGVEQQEPDNVFFYVFVADYWLTMWSLFNFPKSQFHYL